jgi:hypothetical protein
MGHNNTWSKKMRSYARDGVVLVAKVEEWVGLPVTFAPDGACDREPWTLAEGPDVGYVRFNGSEIRPLTDEHGNFVYKETHANP